jgi:hypothetical protein
MKLHSRYHCPADPPGVTTTLYEFDTEQEMNESVLLQDKRGTACFKSGGKYYAGGHFDKRNFPAKPVYNDGGRLSLLPELPYGLGDRLRTLRYGLALRVPVLLQLRTGTGLG